MVSCCRNNTLMPEGISVLPDPNQNLATSPSTILIDVKVRPPQKIILYFIVLLAKFILVIITLAVHTGSARRDSTHQSIGRRSSGQQQRGCVVTGSTSTGRCESWHINEYCMWNWKFQRVNFGSWTIDYNVIAV